jgi:hypothetical protein
MSLKKQGSFHNDDEFVELGNSPSHFESSSESSCHCSSSEQADW